MEAVQHRVGWVQNLQTCLERLGWGEVGVEAVHGLSAGEIQSMLENHVMQLTQEDWNRHQAKAGNIAYVENEKH
jgi:hypothetical protein